MHMLYLKAMSKVVLHQLIVSSWWGCTINAVKSRILAGTCSVRVLFFLYSTTTTTTTIMLLFMRLCHKGRRRMYVISITILKLQLLLSLLLVALISWGVFIHIGCQFVEKTRALSMGLLLPFNINNLLKNPFVSLISPLTVLPSTSVCFLSSQGTIGGNAFMLRSLSANWDDNVLLRWLRLLCLLKLYNCFPMFLSCT